MKPTKVCIWVFCEKGFMQWFSMEPMKVYIRVFCENGFLEYPKGFVLNLFQWVFYKTHAERFNIEPRKGSLVRTSGIPFVNPIQNPFNLQCRP